MARPTFLLPLDSEQTQMEVEAVVNCHGPFQGSIVVFPPEWTELWSRWERSTSISGAPSNEDTIQLWSFGVLQIARAILLNYFAKTTFGEQFWTMMETAEDSHSLKALAAWIVDTHFAEDDVEESLSPTRRRNTNSYEFKSVDTTVAEPSAWSFLNPLDEGRTSE